VPPPHSRSDGRVSNLARNLTRKLLRAHLVAGELEPGATLTLGVDQVLIEDATGTMTAMQFEMLGVDRVEVALAVMYVDHNVLQIGERTSRITSTCKPALHGVITDPRSLGTPPSCLPRRTSRCSTSG